MIIGKAKASVRRVSVMGLIVDTGNLMSAGNPFDLKPNRRAVAMSSAHYTASHTSRSCRGRVACDLEPVCQTGGKRTTFRLGSGSLVGSNLDSTRALVFESA